MAYNFFVLMVKRKDKKIYSDLQKTTCEIFLTEEDANRALENHELKNFFHVDEYEDCSKPVFIM
jgi:hypothetical protein